LQSERFSRGVEVTTAKNDASNEFAGASLVPVVGIDVAEWSALIAFGQRRGELSTEDIVDALRDLELSPEVIDSVRSSIEKIGIKVDQSFELDDSGELRRPALNGHKGASQKAKSSRHERGGDDGGQDAIRMYLQEISRIALLTADEEKVLGRKIVLGSEARAELDSLGDDVSTLDRRRLQRVIDQGRRAREDLTNANLRLVVSIAKRYTKVSMPLADAIQSGNIGLMKAVEKFDYTRGFKFSTYATWWIKQAISRAVAEESRNIRIPTHAMENINRALRVQRELTQLNQREPTIIEIAKALGESPERVAEYFSLAADTTSLDQPTRADGDSTIADHIADADAVDPSGGIELEDMREAMRVVLDELPERERDVMKMRFGLNAEHGATLEEVGQAFNITRERVRQIEVRALFRLRHVSSGKALRNFVEE
jgi:RNA polymerase primary sigma factor